MSESEIQNPESETPPGVAPDLAGSGAGESLTVFALGGRNFTVGEVLRAAEFRGELDPVRRALADLLARQSAAQGAGEEPDLDRAQALAEQFRYERDLITTEETEQWFAKRGLTMEDFEAFVVRQSFGAGLSSDESPNGGGPSVAPDEHDLIAELHFTGVFDQLATALAWRVVAARTAPVAAEGADELARLEAAFQEVRRAVVTPERCAQLLRFMRLPLTRLRIESLALPDRDTAQEAFLCATHDGATLRELAESAGQPHREEELRLEQIPEEWQPKFLAAPIGGVLPPLERDGAFVIHRALAKTEPSLEQPVTRARVEDRLLGQHFNDVCGQAVRWKIAPREQG